MLKIEQRKNRNEKKLSPLPAILTRTLLEFNYIIIGVVKEISKFMENRCHMNLERM